MRRSQQSDRKNISLILGSGGARGLAHIGVIQILEEQGYQISSISGSSMGALIGGIYAAGELSTYTDWVCALDRLDVLRLLDLSFSGAAIFKGERIINALRELIGDWDIEDLPIAFTAVATDLDESKEVWLSSGPLFDAIRASIGFPTIFQPWQLKGRMLVDGGLVNPIPIAPTLRDMTDLSVAVNLNGHAVTLPELQPEPEPSDSATRQSYKQKIIAFIESLQRRNHQPEEDEDGFFEIVTKSLDAMQSTIAAFKLAAYRPDILIEIPKNICTIYEFERAEELIQIGRRQTEHALEKWDAPAR